MLRFSSRQWRTFNRIRRKHKVSLEFLQYNLPNILKFIAYGLRLRIVMKLCAIRKDLSVVLKYNQLTRLTFDDDLMVLKQRKRAKRRSRILKQWSRGMVQHLRRVIGVREFEEILPKRKMPAKDVINEMKKQLELLKAGKRSKQLIEDIGEDVNAAATGEDVAKEVGQLVELEPMSEKSTNAENLDANENEQNFVLNEKTGFLEEVSESVVIDLDTSVEEMGDQQIEKTKDSKASVLDEIDEVKTANKEGKLSEEKTNKVFENVDASKSTADILHKKTDHQETISVEDKIKATKVLGDTSKSSANILDFLMQKVFAPKIIENKNEDESLRKDNSIETVLETDADVDSSEEFLGFAEDERLPGMMRTPLVLLGRDDKSAFISQSLDDYFRANALDTSVDVAQLTKLSINRKVRQTNIEGLMTPNCHPPALSMPALPEALLKLRTVAERRQYLQKCSRSSKLAIINNEASIYRELQRKMRHPRIRCANQHALQTSTSSQMPFTRQGWQAASFINTELNKYYFQKVNVKESAKPECITLRGVFGNNNDKFKPTYSSRPPHDRKNKCASNCVDCYMAPCLKPIPTFASKKKLNVEPLRPLFKPCPLSQKPKQQLFDKEAAEAGDMAVVRLPAVELAVSPELGKSFNDIAKRYLQFITPFTSISREWAEFSVSTLQEPSLMSPKSEIKAEKPPHKTFVFTIPYANDRSQILVRRIVHREESIDPFFRRSENVPRWSGLSFRDDIDEDDEIAMECADVVTDMINSVAISCCEDSFVLDDDITESIPFKLKAESAATMSKAKPPIKVANSLKVSPVHNKNARLFNELRRLNATIIDTQSQPKKDDYQCPKEFCALSCICGSLASVKGTNQHCGKLKCMFHCDCSTSNASQIMRLESDGRSISTEDAVMMRRLATARLARMEKEFTSTIVVTENETLLINDSAYEKRRRAARLPKRYEDYHHTDDEFSRVSPVKSTLNESSEFRSPSTVFSDRTMYDRDQDPVMVKDVVLQKLKHCSVPLIPFDEVQNMAVFCLVHQLYKCFCGGHATEGKRVIIEKENPNAAKSEGGDLVLRSPKSRYSFEKAEEQLPLPPSAAATHKTNHSITKASTNLEKDPIVPQTPKSHKPAIVSNNQRSLLKGVRPKTETSENVAQSRKRLSTVESDSSADHLAGSPIKKSKTLLGPAPSDFIKDNREQNVLTPHFKRSETHGCSRFLPVPSRTYRSRNRKQADNVRNKMRTTEDRATQLLLNEHIMRSVYFHKEMVKAEKAKLQLKSAVGKKKQNKSLAIKRHQSELSLPLPIAKQPKVEIAECPEENSADIGDDESQQTTLVSQCYSLTNVADSTETSEDSSEPTTSSQKEIAPTKDDDGDVELDMRENYNEVIKTLNGLVSRKMHDIDNAIKRDSKVVPPPTEDILCVLRWRNFSEAYHENFIYVWEVKMKNRSFLAATVKNIIPIVPGALGVMNILAVPTCRLPLIGRLLLLPFTYNEASSLAVIMQGRSQYWYIKGFLEPNGAKACLRPTPETHPELTLKINTLCSSLIKQRTREQERQSHMQKQRRVKPQQQQEIQANPLPQTEMVKATAPSSPANTSKQLYLNALKDCIKTSNVAVRRVTPADIATLKSPQIYDYDHRWFVLDWAPDFSHIFIPELKELISYEHISRLNEMAALKKTVHRMEFHEKNRFAAYFVPGSKEKIYFGPFTRGQPSPVIVLMQKVNGEMMPREVYEKMRLLKPHLKATTAFWMTQINKRIYFDEAIKIGPLSNETQSKAKATAAAESTSSDDEDDCVIVENELRETKTTKVASVNEAASKASPISTPPISTPHMKFTIETSAATNALKISSADGFELCHNANGTTSKPRGENDAEAKAKILSVFKLPTMARTTTTNTLSDATAPKRHSLNLPDTTNSNLKPCSLNKSLSAVEKSSKTYQHEFSKLVRPMKNTNSKVQVGQSLTPATYEASTSMKNLQPKSQSLGNFKLYTTPTPKNATTTSTTTHPGSFTAAIRNMNANTQSAQMQGLTNVSSTTTKPTAVPVHIMKAEKTQIKTVSTTTNVGNTFSIHNLQRPITIKRVGIDGSTPAGSHPITPVKRLSSGIIKLPAGIIRAIKPINACSNMQQTTPSMSIPAGLKVAKISPTSAPQAAVYPINLVAATQSDVTTISLSTSAPQTVTSPIFTKTVMQNPTPLTNLQYLQFDKNIMTAAANRGISISKTLYNEQVPTTQPTPQTSEFPAAKFVPIAPNFLAKKTAAPSVKRPNQAQSNKIGFKNSMWKDLPQQKNVFKDDSPDKKLPTKPQSTSSPIKLTTQQNQRPKLQQKPQKPSVKVGLPEFFADSDVILIDD